MLAIGLMMFNSVTHAQSVNGNVKATFSTSYVALLKPVSSSTGGSGPITTPWTTVLEQPLKTAQKWDLVVQPSFEIGLLTSTTVSSRNMVTDTATASACVKVRVLVDDNVIAPGEVVYNKRAQTLSAQLEGAIASCLSVVTNLTTGGLLITLDTNCVAPETISLLQDTMTANSFTFVAPTLESGIHKIQVQAQIATMGDNQNGTFKATALIGKGTLIVDSSRTAKQSLVQYPF